MGGIMRDVTVRALPDLHIRDMDIRAGLAQGYTTGTACVKLSLDGTGAEKAKVSWKLYDGRIRMEVPAEEKCILSGEERVSVTESTAAVQFSLNVPEVKPWSAEIPWLYRLVITVRDEEGKILESAAQNVGFRQVEIRDAVLYFNGKRLRINGVNRHEFSARKGRAIGFLKTEQYQCCPYQSLSQSELLVRTVRPVRDLCDGRDESGNARDLASGKIRPHSAGRFP